MVNSSAEEHFQGSSEAVLHLHLTASSSLVQHLPAVIPGGSRVLGALRGGLQSLPDPWLQDMGT